MNKNNNSNNNSNNIIKNTSGCSLDIIKKRIEQSKNNDTIIIDFFNRLDKKIQDKKLQDKIQDKNINIK